MPSPLEGRRLWIAGIGGAGMSAYALLSHAWGAEVSGWDRVATPYLEHLPAAIDVVIADDPPAVPAGWEAVVSSAFTGTVPGKTRADLLTELVSLRDSIVVAGAHGKTTTTAMIAFALKELGHDPAFLIGGDVRQLGGNAAAGQGWLVVEGDESDRTISTLRPNIAVLLNVDLDHHTTFSSKAEVQELFDEWLSHVPHVVHAEKLPPFEGALAVAGEHNRRNAAAALAALELAGIDRTDGARALAQFRGVGRRLESHGDVRGVRVVDDYAHNPAKVAAALETARNGGRILVLFQPHLYSRTRHLAHELASALAAADVVAVADIYAAREAPVADVTGKLVVDELARLRPGATVAWTPSLEDGARFLAARARAGDVVMTIGAGDVDRAVSIVWDALE